MTEREVGDDIMEQQARQENLIMRRLFVTITIVRRHPHENPAHVNYIPVR